MRTLQTLIRLVLALTLCAVTCGAQDSFRPRLDALILTGDGQHDWRFSSANLRQALEASGKFRVEVELYPAAALMDAARLREVDVVIVDTAGARWGDAAERAFLDAVRAGLGVVIAHGGAAAFPDWPEYGQLVGGRFAERGIPANVGPLDVRLADVEHPLLAGFGGLRQVPDEAPLGFQPLEDGEALVLARAESKAFDGGTGRTEPVVLANTFGDGRVVTTSLGHVWIGDESTWRVYDNEGFQELVIRACEFAATGGVTPLRRLSPNTLTGADYAAGWQLLFDGRSLDGWRSFDGGIVPQDQWSVEGGALKVLASDGAGGMVHEERFQDFELEAEWRVTGEGTAGLHYRMSAEEEDAGRGLRYHVPGEDGGEEGEHLTPEQIFGPAANLLQPPGRWNHARVVADGQRIEHWLNGVRLFTIDMSTEEWAQRIRESRLADHPDLAQLPIGHIGLQHAGVTVWYRNLKIRRLFEPAPVLAKSPQVIELFNGRDLSGWSEVPWVDNGATDFEVIEDGLLHNRGTMISYLRTQRRFTSFVLEMEYRFHPTTRQAGDAGLLLRAQGKRDSQDAWPACIEVDLQVRNAGDVWTWPDFQVDADRHRTNGQITRRFADAEQPVGEWNQLVVRLENGVLSVEMGGVAVNAVTGVPVVAGFVALAAQGVEVQYRNLRLTPLE